MWKSQDDIVKDLASLNDFGTPGDKEPYRVLYSIGRGTKVKEKNKSSGKFLDSRTGEVIDAGDEILDIDYYCKGRGRGSLLGGFSRSKFQLQQQLRLARPLGSGDEAIESYCRRNQPKEQHRNSATVPDTEMDTKSEQTAARNSNSKLNLNGMRHRIKAVRNSSTESNALINGLLTKCNQNSETQVTSKEGNFISNVEEQNLGKTLNFNKVIVNCNDNGNIVETDCNEFNTDRCSLNNLSDADKFLKGECSGKTACLKDTLCSSNKSSRAAQVVSVETPNYFKEEKEQRNEETNKIKYSQNYSEKNFSDSAKIQHERNEKYRLLGEKLNRLRKADAKTSENGIYDFSEISNCIAPIDFESETNSMAVIVTNSVPKYFIKDEDFPPLLNSSLKPFN